MLAKKDKPMEAAIPTSSMADIAFLLLLFFLVTTTINTDKGIPLVLPPPAETKEVPKKNLCNIFINPFGEVLLDQQVVQIREIQNIVREKISGNENLIISIKTSNETPYDIYIQVLDQVKLAGATKISIAEPEA